MKKIFWRSTLLCMFTAFIFSACSDDDDKKPGIDTSSGYGAYVLNNGQMNTNSASVSWFSIDENKMTENVFRTTNGIGLGELGQDVLEYGSKLYITVQSSGVIYVTDKNLKVISTIKTDNEGNSILPRYMKTHNGKIYLTLFDKYLARIDTTSLTIDAKIETGPNPEMLEIINNKIYVANSGGLNETPNNTVSIVNLELTSKTDIEVVSNPVELKKDKNNNLYLVSRGNYTTIPNTLQQINTTTNEVTVLDKGRSFSIFPIDDKLWILNKGYDESNNWAPYSSFLYYDINAKKIVDESFITDGTTYPDISYMTKEPVSGDYYVLVANGTNNGDLCIFSSAGKFKSKYDTGSTFPIGVYFMKK